MKKAALSFGFVAASAAYIFYLHLTGSAGTPGPALSAAQQDVPAATSPLSPAVGSTSGPVAIAPQPQKSSPTPAPVPTSPPQPKSSGMYKDGTYSGSQADAYYGTVQVQATVQNGKLASVDFLQYPNDRRTSQFINGQAMPILRSEAIQAQSANVDIVSGATDTSMAFQQSLAAALAQAKRTA